MVLTNCSNNYGPWQYPEKLIPVVILKAAAGEPIPLHGVELNVREAVCGDHVEALVLVATRGRIDASYCLGDSEERNNPQVLRALRTLMHRLLPQGAPNVQKYHPGKRTPRPLPPLCTRPHTDQK